MFVPLDRAEIGLIRNGAEGADPIQPAWRVPMKKCVRLGACLVVLTLIACQLPPANSPPNTQEEFQFSEDWKSR